MDTRFELCKGVPKNRVSRSLFAHQRGAFAYTGKNVRTVKRFYKTTQGAIQEPLRNELLHNKNCRFRLQCIAMQLNKSLSVANIVENRYIWTEPPDMNRVFHCRQISATRLDSRRHELGATTVAVVIRLAANTKNWKYLPQRGNTQFQCIQDAC